MRLNKLFTIILLLSFSFVVITAMINALSATFGVLDSVKGAGYIKMLMVFLSFSYFIYNIHIVRSMPRIFVYGMLFCFFTIISLFKTDYGIEEVIRAFTDLIFWLILFVVGFQISFVNKKDYHFASNYVAFVVLGVSAFLFLNKVLISPSDGSFATLDTSILLIVMLPFVFNVKNNILRFSLIALIGVTSFISLKRSTVLAFVVATIIYQLYLVLKTQRKSKKQILNFLKLIVVLVGVFYLFHTINNITDNSLSQRIEAIWTDGGSGRDIIFAKTIAHIKEANFNNFVIGHGYKAAEKTFGVFAHNDFIEILFNFGVIALSVFLLFLRELFIIGIRLAKARNVPNNTTASYFATIGLFLILGMLNVFVVVPVFMGTIMFYMGITIGMHSDIIKKRRIKLNKNSGLVCE